MKSGIQISRLALFILLLFGMKGVYSASTDFHHQDITRSHFIRNSSGTIDHATTASIAYSSSALAPPTIILIAVPFELRIAQLSWSTNDPGMSGTYFIEREAASSGIWDTIGQMPYNSASLQFSDTISFPYCNPTSFSYRIIFIAVSPADNAISNSQPLILSDKTSPANVFNEIITVNFIRKPELTWSRVTGDDILGYRIDRSNGFSYDSIATVSADSSRFIDQSVLDGCNKSFAYVIITLDQCRLRSAPIYFPAKQTITLNFPEIGECERKAKLSWNPYYLMPGGLGGYKVFRMVDYGATVEIANITDTLRTTYDDLYNFENGHFYSYSVQAYSKTGIGISSSCIMTWKYAGVTVPDSVYITKVNVENDSFVRVSFHSSPGNSIKKLVLERSDDGGTSFQTINTWLVDAHFVPQDFYLDDKAVDVHSQSYSYRLIASDSCGIKSINSNISRTIYLDCSATKTQNNSVWNSYEKYIKLVSRYKVYRTVEGSPEELIDSVPNTILTYSDFTTFSDPSKKVCYRVAARENPGNIYIIGAESGSNTCCIMKDPTFYISNAFRPASDITKNLRFKPITTFVDPLTFTMTIFNRWGQQVFETTDMYNGWDGMIAGKPAQSGLYAYIITYSSYTGMGYTKRGTVFLVR